MSGFLLHVGAVLTCPHVGKVEIIPAAPRVFVNKQPVALQNNTFTVMGCPFTVPTSKPQPCVTVQWPSPAVRVFSNKVPVVLATSVGTCLSAEQAPQGPPIVQSSQFRVRGT